MAGRVATVDQWIYASAFVFSLRRRCASTPARALKPGRSRSLIPLFIPLVSESDAEAWACGSSMRAWSRRRFVNLLRTTQSDLCKVVLMRLPVTFHMNPCAF